MRVKGLYFVYIGFMMLLLLNCVSSEENITQDQNITINNSNVTNVDNVTNVENMTNVTNLENVTNVTNIENMTNATNVDNVTNVTNINLTQINNTLTNILNNLTSIENLINETNETFNFSSLDNSTCYYAESQDEYNITINGTDIPKNITIHIALCYNQTTVYCESDTPIHLYMINLTNVPCGGNGCSGENVQQISNFYNIQDVNFTNPWIFVCWSKKKQDYNNLWLYQSLALTEDKSNVFIFDFSNSTFLSNEYNITNTTIFNITNDYSNNITNNISYFYNITNNIENNMTANLTDIENRLTLLEQWKESIINLLDELNRKLEHISYQIDKILESLVRKTVYNFSNSVFKAEEYNVTNKILSNITNNITNNLTTEIVKEYNITNNITTFVIPENLTNVENRLTVLEQWRLDVTETINFLINMINELAKKVGL